MPPHETECARWFADELRPHEPALRGYLRSRVSPAEVDDIVQESYLRVWRARARQPIQFARAFLFRVAHNVALNLLQHERASPIDSVADLDALPVLEDGPNAAEAACTREEILLLADGIESLPARCREIFVLRRIKGVPQREIAARLGISEQTVQVQVQRGVRRCAEFLRRCGVERGFPHARKL